MDLRIDAEPHLLWARFSGPIDIGYICGQMDWLARECQVRTLDLLLIDFRGVELAPLTTFDRYRLGTSLLAGKDILRKVASVAAPELIDPEKFGAKVAQNRGINLQPFSDEKAARAWLLGDLDA